MAKQPWVQHEIVGGACRLCGIEPPASAIVGEVAAYHLEGLGWLTHRPEGLVRIVLCGAEDDNW